MICSPCPECRLHHPPGTRCAPPTTAPVEVVEMLAGASANAVDVMEMQEKRESGEFHITGEVMFGLWSDAKARIRAALEAAKPYRAKKG